MSCSMSPSFRGRLNGTLLVMLKLCVKLPNSNSFGPRLQTGIHDRGQRQHIGQQPEKSFLAQAIVSKMRLFPSMGTSENQIKGAGYVVSEIGWKHRNDKPATTGTEGCSPRAPDGLKIFRHGYGGTTIWVYEVWLSFEEALRRCGSSPQCLKGRRKLIELHVTRAEFPQKPPPF